MKLDEGTMRLIAVGASVTANCLPCLEHNIAQAHACGLASEEIADAIEVGKMVRSGAINKVNELIDSLNTASPVSTMEAKAHCCG